MLYLKKCVIVFAVILTALFVFTRCSSGESAGRDSRGSQYAGSESCISCHQDVANSYVHNSHYKTSGKADYKFLKSIINAANNTINFQNNQKVIINNKDSVFYQTGYKNDQKEFSKKIDISFGAAIKAQTYGYWQDSQLYQLPLTYLTNEKLWTNSPGFPIDHPYFTRIIPSRCLECHTSFARVNEQREGTLLQIKQVYDPGSIIYGIDCERCHGPAAQHVKFQEENPGVKEAKFITSIKSLTRQQQVDLCGTCHSGDPIKIKSIFNFVPGDTLSRYYLFYNPASGEPDVHGMQLQLLQLSKCFRQSKMTCITCHAPHQSKEDMEAQINQCVSCHQQVNHKIDIKVSANNCITCHMPLRSSKSLDFNNETEANNIHYMLRTHRIAVYPKNEWK